MLEKHFDDRNPEHDQANGCRHGDEQNHSGREVQRRPHVFDPAFGGEAGHRRQDDRCDCDRVAPEHKFHHAFGVVQGGLGSVAEERSEERSDDEIDLRNTDTDSDRSHQPCRPSDTRVSKIEAGAETPAAPNHLRHLHYELQHTSGDHGPRSERSPGSEKGP